MGKRPQWLTRLLFAATLAFLTGRASAQSPEFPRDVLSGIDAMQRLPVDGFHIVESQGRLLLVSTNGHYAVMGGRILDLWNSVEIHSVSDVDQTLRIPLHRMGIKLDELGAVTVGQGAQEAAVTVFLDPASPETHRILPKIQSLLGRYAFNVVFVPAQATRKNASRALICAPEAGRDFVRTGHQATVVADGDPCGTAELQKNMVVVSLLGIDVLPFTIAPNGATQAGIPEQYDAFIAANLE